MIAVSGITCAVPPPDKEKPLNENSKRVSQGRFTLPQQKVPPRNIQSIQLYAKKDPKNPPIITLNSNETLTLAFDFLGEQNQQFRLEVSHRTQSWEESNISPTIYLDSFSHTYIQDSKESFSQRPTFQHIEYEFPNSQLNPIVSGNYLLEVYHYEKDEVLFSMPFFVTENQGELQTRVETLYAQRGDQRSLDQLYSTYRFPAFVEFPQFDLSMSYVQNQFWGRMQKVQNLDTMSPGELNGYLQRDAAFISDYNFKSLELRTFDVDGQQIVEYMPEYTPPQVILRRDVQNLSSNTGYSPGFTDGYPINGRNGNYAEVFFYLETQTSITQTADIYLVGGFNNWMINRFNKMTYNPSTDLWEGSALIKQGEYPYTYVLVEDNQINELALDDNFSTEEQEYLTFIYYEDPTHNYDRLLKVEKTSSR